jgi:tRNA-specific 2-thiouridylase
VVGLLRRARALGFDALATGHYARVEGGRLYRAADHAKDQSYVLYMLGPGELHHLRLPLGRMTKPEVRATAARLGLRTAAKPESFDVCFVPDGDTAGWLERRLGRRPGEVVDTAGRVLGGHQGAYRYTVGQRRGLGVATATPRYVLRVEPAAARVVVGERAELAMRAVALERATTTDGRGLRPGHARVRLRAHGREVGCRVVPLDGPEGSGEPQRGAPVDREGSGEPRGGAPVDGGRARLELDEPVTAVAPGQAAVLYDGDLVLGGGTVAATVPAEPTPGA